MIHITQKTMKRIIKKFSPVLLLFLIISINCKKNKIKETLFSAPEITEYADSSVSVTVEILEVGVVLKNYGFCYGLHTGPSLDDYKTVNPGDNAKPGTFTEVITGLYPNTTYYIRTYAEEETIRYGKDEIRFTTSYVISFPDAYFEQAVRNGINKPNGDIYASDVNQITEFYADGIDSIESIEGIQYFTQLQNLNLYSNQISDISPLSGLINLTQLGLQINQISDISPISGLTNLTTLDLIANQISDISPLSGLTNLTTLSLEHNQISEISALSGLTNLNYLSLYYNQISDISPITGLTNLTGLRLDGNQISDISTLAGLTNLTSLTSGDNPISDISSIAGLTNLTYLWLAGNEISDISPVSGLTNLTFINLAVNQISDISPLSGLTNIRDLWLHINQISDIYPLVQNSGMDDGDVLGLSDNPLSATSINNYIPILQGRGVNVNY